MKKLNIVILVLFFVPTLIFAGNIFIEEGDLFNKIGIVPEESLSRVEEGGSITAVVKDVGRFEAMGFSGKLQPGDKVKLLYEGKGEWSILDINSGRKLGRVHILL